MRIFLGMLATFKRDFIPPTRRVDPVWISFTAASAESHTFDLVGTGIDVGVP
jgi:hypothetical protein